MKNIQQLEKILFEKGYEHLAEIHPNAPKDYIMAYNSYCVTKKGYKQTTHKKGQKIGLKYIFEKYCK